MAIVYRVGHSNRDPEELLGILKREGIELVIDVRWFPGSRKFPWFSRENLERELGRAGIGYLWLGDRLGEFRRFGVDAEDTGGTSCFISPGFRAYALYVTTNPGARGLCSVSRSWLGVGELPYCVVRGFLGVVTARYCRISLCSTGSPSIK